MRLINFTLFTVMAIVLSACGGDDKSSGTAVESAASTATESMAETADSMGDTGDYGGIIDHSNDVAEFEIRRSIAGLERMIEQYTADGYATDELEAEKAAQQERLAAL